MNGRFSEEEEVDSPASCQLQQVFAFCRKGMVEEYYRASSGAGKIGWKISLFSVTLLLTADDDSAAAVERRL